MKIDLILFDLDGTLIDSCDDIVQSVNLALASLGRPTYPVDQVANCIGRGIRNLFRSLVGQLTCETDVDSMVGAFRKFYSLHMMDHTRVFPGVIETLRHFEKKPKVILTNKSQVSADNVVDAMSLRGYFDGVFGSDVFSTQKPDPGPIREICRKFDVALDRAVMVGDTVVDITAGKSAGAKTALVLFGYGDNDAAREMKPDFELSRMADLIPLIQN